MGPVRIGTATNPASRRTGSQVSEGGSTVLGQLSGALSCPAAFYSLYSPVFLLSTCATCMWHPGGVYCLVCSYASHDASHCVLYGQSISFSRTALGKRFGSSIWLAPRGSGAEKRFFRRIFGALGTTPTA